MTRKNTAGNGHFGRLMTLCVVTFALCSGAALAADKPNRQKGKSASSAYQISKPASTQVQKALEFQIPKSMSGRMNAIQWTFGASKIGRPVLSGNQYQFVNLAIERGLKHQKRGLGANLGFQDTSTNNYNVMVKRKNGNGQLRYGDIVALKLRPYGWLRHKKQGKFGGINLGDDNHNPHYIWKITGGKTGTKIYSGMPFALYNTAPYKTEVIFCPRSSGIDLGWRGRSDCDTTLAKVSGKVFGANGALSGDGLTGKIAKEWKGKLCQAAVASASAYVTGQTGGAGAAGVKAAAPVALKKCNDF